MCIHVHVPIIRTDGDVTAPQNLSTLPSTPEVVASEMIM